MISVTVLMPVYNAERYLTAAISSVLRQTYRDFELLAVDDGSTDGSREILASCKDPRVRVLLGDRNEGITATLNRGLAEARGSLIARQDADDISHPRRLELQVRQLALKPELALLGCQGQAIDEHGRRRGRIDLSQTPESIRWFQLFDNAFIHSGVVFRREVAWDLLGGYSTHAPHCEDYDLWSRMMAHHASANLPQRLISRRIHGASVMAAVGAGRDESTEEAVRRIMRHNLVAAFGREVVTPNELALLARFRLGLDRTSWRPFRELFQRLLSAFCVMVPSARRAADFRWTLALQWSRLAYGLLPSEPRLAFGAYAAALRLSPSIGRSVPWTKVLALALLGERPRAAYQRRHS